MIGERAKDDLVHLLWIQPENVNGHQVWIIGGETAVCVVDVLLGGVGGGNRESQGFPSGSGLESG